MCVRTAAAASARDRSAPRAIGSTATTWVPFRRAPYCVTARSTLRSTPPSPPAFARFLRARDDFQGAASLALGVGRELVVHLKRSGGQTQYSSPLRLQIESSEPLADLPLFIHEHLGEELSVERLARKSGLGPRQFSRRFSEQFGDSPAAFVERLRLEEAGRLLIESSAGHKRIAQATGFRSTDVFRRAFQRRFGILPREYRARFSARG